MARIQLPDYGRSTLTEVLPAVASHLLAGLPGLPGNAEDCRDVLGIPQARRYVMVMVDGLGHDLLIRQRFRAPYLGSLLEGAIGLTSGVPSTTATSLSSIGTGTVPGRHGIVGYSFRALGEIINALTWDDRLDPLTFQPQPTWFEKLEAHPQIAVSTVSLAKFEDSGLTQAALRGSRFIGLIDENDTSLRIEQIVAASRVGERSFVYAYERRLDHAGHGMGCLSEAWNQTLDEIDAWIEQLRSALDPQTCLIVTGDHGMVDVPSNHQIVIEDTPVLTNGLDLIGGEGRLRQLYCDRPDEVATRWRRWLGERAIVRTRDEAIDEGWFGTVDDRMRDRIGDVLVALQGDWAIMTQARAGELTLVGQHGSLTPEEMRVPLLIDQLTAD